MEYSRSPLSHWCVPQRLFVAGNTCPFFLLLFSLSLPLSFSLSFLPGCFRHSWEPPFQLVCPWTLASSFSFLPPPPPSFLARGVSTSKQGFCNRFLNEVWTVIGLSPFIWFPFHRTPQTSSLLFIHVSSSSSFLSLARTIVRTLVCTHTRVFYLQRDSGGPGLLQ